MAQLSKDVPRNMMHESKDVETHPSIRKIILRNDESRNISFDMFRPSYSNGLGPFL
ncbi:hypothetical protein HanRHA438_Chr03g0143051 [Helianthus annuus]|nr:hypothetical protein HanRHA438_Chr03g0143051 [Helianthus annuus]